MEGFEEERDEQTPTYAIPARNAIPTRTERSGMLLMITQKY